MDKDSLKSNLVALAIGALIGAISFAAAYFTDLYLSKNDAMGTRTFLAFAVLSASAFALGALPTIRRLFTQDSNSIGQIKRAVHSSTLPFALILTVSLAARPSITSRELLTVFALALFFNVIAERYFLRQISVPQPHTYPARIASFFDSTPHLSFTIAALFLLSMASLGWLANQRVLADRLSNWAYGFLMLSIGLALVQFLDLPDRIKEWIRVGLW